VTHAGAVAGWRGTPAWATRLVRPLALVIGWLLVLVLALVLASANALAAQPATPRGALRADTVWSQSLGIRKRLLTYLPPSYVRDTSRRFPVLFYLHGLYGNEDNWLQQARLDQVMDSLIASGLPEAIVVMPDGDDSWYTTWATLPNAAACARDTARAEPAASYCVPWPHYDDYVARDLVAHVDSAYRTLADPGHRGIAGLSMGGFGAVTLALRYPDVFSAAASHSGVLAPALLGPRPFTAPPVWASTPEELQQAAGARYRWFSEAFGRDTIGWYARDPSHLVQRLVTAGTAVPALFLDCGRGDAFLDQNRAFVATLSSLGLSHRYDEPEGGHTWTYWRARLPHSLSWLLTHVASGVTNGDRPPDGARRDPR
jgi:putative tributyrin esterase